MPSRAEVVMAASRTAAALAPLGNQMAENFARTANDLRALAGLRLLTTASRGRED
jgi:hypothetical protein